MQQTGVHLCAFYRRDPVADLWLFTDDAHRENIDDRYPTDIKWQKLCQRQEKAWMISLL